MADSSPVKKENMADSSVRLPEELETEIILHLPVKSLIRFKLVSKNWYSLIRSSSFIKSQYQFSVQKSHLLSVSNSMLIIQGKSSVFSIQLSVKQHHHITNNSTCYAYYYDANLIPLNHTFIAYENLKPLASCDGLICIQANYYSRKVYLWNPALNETRQIKDFPFFLSYHNPYGVKHLLCGTGLGFVSLSDDYKMVYIVYCGYDNWAVYVYTLRTNTWRKLDPFSACIGLLDKCTGSSVWSKSFEAAVLLNEVLHWIVPASKYCDNLRILKFDLNDELFEVVPSVENEISAQSFNRSCLGVTRENKLCVYQIRRKFPDARDLFSLNIWKLEEYGNWDSWIKVCSLELEGAFQCQVPTLLTSTDGGKVLIRDVGASLILVDLSQDPPLFVHVGNRTSYDTPVYAISYVESLVSPFR